MLTLQEIQSQFDHFIDRGSCISPDFQAEMEEFKLAVMRKIHQGEAFETAFVGICSDAEKCLMEIRLMEQNAKQIKENLKK